MTLPGWRTALVLGGPGSGRREVAAALLADVPDHRTVTREAGTDLADLARLVGDAGAGETLLVDDLDRWLPGTARGATAAPGEQLAELAAAVRDTPARVVVASADPGGAPRGAAAAARATAEAVGALNRAVADAAEAVVLVVAGQPLWLKGGPHRRPASAVTAAAPAAPVTDPATVPHPDAAAGKAAATRLAGSGLGALAAAVSFAASTQGDPEPRGWRQVRVLVLAGDHAGAAAAGAGDAAGRVAALRDGTGPLALLADHAGTVPRVVECPPAAPIEDGPAATEEVVDEALARGAALAGQAVDEGVDVLAIGALGSGADTAAAAVATLLGGGTAEAPALLGRVRAADGRYDDDAWIRRCVAVRDAVRRVRRAHTGAGRDRAYARVVLAEVGGADVATATGVILGAAARRTPVLLDGPVGAAAALAARRMAAAAGQWCLLVDHGGHPTAVHAADQLHLSPLLDLRLDVGEGAAVLAALPLLRLAGRLAGTGGPGDPEGAGPAGTAAGTGPPAAPAAAPVSGSTSGRTAA